MKIALASQSRKKIDAVKLAFQEVAGVELLTIKAPSNVHEQPLGDETFQGARNRLAFTRQACADADIYISIENGLFMRGGPTWLDRKVAELSYYCLVNVMPLLSVYEGYTPHKKFPFYTSDYKPHLGSVH